MDRKLRLIKFSPNAVKHINLVEADVGRPITDISTNIRFDTIIEDVKEVVSFGNTIKKEIETKDGKWYQVITMPYIMYEDNRNNGAIITFNEITDLKKAQLELNTKNEMLVRINGDLDNFVQTASHDLLGPLSAIQFSISLLNEINMKDPRLSAILKSIHSSIKKFVSLIKDLATVAKIESGVIETEVIDIEEILRNIEWSLSDKINSSGAEIKRDLKIEHVAFSKKNLRSILYNFISNGIKFRSGEHPVIIIHSRTEDGNVIISVEDNGIGMDAASVSKIFGLYNRLRQDIEGQGVGLYLVKKIIDGAGGVINVESKPGKGSKFIISFKDITATT